MLYVLNDLHIGVQRSAGTTPTSSWALRQYVLDYFKSLMDKCTGDLLINGDMFDGYQIPYSDLLEAFKITNEWLKLGHKLYLSAGNHDLSTNSTKLSSFEFFCMVLKSSHPERVVVIKGAADIGEGRYVISHVPNQDLFNLELEKVPSDCKFLFLHCNYDNKFAQEVDHSLNLSANQAETICKNGTVIVLGHEHQGRTIRFADCTGTVEVLGNQFPTSVADCLGNDAKFMGEIRWRADGLLRIYSWYAKDTYAQVDWQELASFSGKHRFIRVYGEAQPEQAADVVNAISKFRNKSDAFVVTNAVKVMTADGQMEFAESAEQVKAFDVMAALLEMLTDEEAAVVKSVMETQND